MGSGWWLIGFAADFRAQQIERRVNRNDSRLGTWPLADSKTVMKVHRPYCRRPKLSAGLNLALCLAVIAASIFLRLPTSLYSLAVVFGACAILFSILTVTNPGTTISIDDKAITRSGRLSGSSLPLNEIASATLERDPDALNYQQITIRSHGGTTLLIDPRFLNPDTDGLVEAVRGRLREHGIELVTERTRAEQD